MTDKSSCSQKSSVIADGDAQHRTWAA